MWVCLSASSSELEVLSSCLLLCSSVEAVGFELVNLMLSGVMFHDIFGGCFRWLWVVEQWGFDKETRWGFRWCLDRLFGAEVVDWWQCGEEVGEGSGRFLEK
ncbi:hypothetical protein KY290_003175 [Solanum tuberosum]|uniref:Transmembrane protein n=1 Tax=Solanum tuberosum TaxID=4113 RepID=A0ABQ7WS65_SOLTU|nr:hypothetical protein KY284_003314 [Solanum tuberosum]KAH0767277.1 hypothetical protein KY285_003148 [Solanum tuberosum]KAH0783577.1 hypothetical protein KY290_003175 [Solanum tuberosum]